MLSVLSPTKKLQHLTIEGFRSECEIPAGRSGLPGGSRRKRSNLAISNLTIHDASVQIQNGHNAGFLDSVIIDSLSSSAFHSRYPLLCLFFRSDFFDSLDALVPDYLDAISIDLMDGGAPLATMRKISVSTAWERTLSIQAVSPKNPVTSPTATKPSSTSKVLRNSSRIQQHDQRKQPKQDHGKKHSDTNWEGAALGSFEKRLVTLLDFFRRVACHHPHGEENPGHKS
jgi:hypothetical protein